MTREPIADWAAARSDKWRRQLDGLEAMLKPIDEPLIRALQLRARCRVADVGCGGGATTLEVLHRASAGSVAHGFDVSPGLIEIARRRRTAGESSVTFEVADMGTAPPPAQPYDRLVSRLGVMFFADPPSAFANLRRWLAPRGRFAFAVWGPIADNAWMSATRDAVAGVVDLPPVDSNVPGPFRYAEAAPLLALLSEAGFAKLAVMEWRTMLSVGACGTAADAARFALASFSSFAELLSEAGGDARTTAHRALTARFAPFEQGGAVRMHACVHIVTGVAGARQ